MIKRNTEVKNILASLSGTSKTREMHIHTNSGGKVKALYQELIKYDSYLLVRTRSNHYYLPYSAIESIAVYSPRDE